MMNQFPGPVLRSDRLSLPILLGLVLLIAALMAPSPARAQPIAADAPQSVQLSYWFDRAARASMKTAWTTG